MASFDLVLVDFDSEDGKMKIERNYLLIEFLSNWFDGVIVVNRIIN